MTTAPRTTDPAGPATPAMAGSPASTEVLSLLARAAEVIRSARYHYANEHQLQEGIAAVLARDGLDAEREARLTRTERIDFLLESGIGVEIKVDGQAGAVWRQLTRYAACPQINGLLLVTTRARHLDGTLTRGHDIPVRTLLLRGGL